MFAGYLSIWVDVFPAPSHEKLLLEIRQEFFVGICKKNTNQHKKKMNEGHLRMRMSTFTQPS